jgi:hypothetical protein
MQLKFGTTSPNGQVGKKKVNGEPCPKSLQMINSWFFSNLFFHCSSNKNMAATNGHCFIKFYIKCHYACI